MAKAGKKTGLLELVAALPDASEHRGHPSWRDALQLIDADLLGEIDELIGRFMARAPEVRSKFPTEMDLAKFIRLHISAAGVSRSIQAIRRYIAEQRHG